MQINRSLRGARRVVEFAQWNRNIPENNGLAHRFAELLDRPGVYACTHGYLLSGSVANL